MVKFAEETSIHGIRDYAHSPNLALKVFWAIAVIGAISFMVYECQRIIAEFLEDHVSTEFSLVEVRHFPPVVFCPQAWLNQTKINEIGFSEDSLRYIYSLLHQNIDEEAEWVQGSSKNANEIEALFYKELPSHYLSKGLDNLLEDISLTAEQIVEVKHGKILQLNKIVKMHSLCYSFEFEDIPKSKIEYIELEVTFHPSNEAGNGHSGPEILLIGEHAFIFALLNFITLHSDAELHILIKQSTNKLIPTSHNQCNYWSEEEHFQCKYNCFSKFVNSSFGCEEYIHAHPLTFATGYCSSLKHGKAKNLPESEAEWEKCYHECHNPCEFKSYSYTINQFPKKSNKYNETKFILKLLDPLYSLQLSEFKTHTWQTLLSNIGGAVSLFCGASILSLVQIMTCCWSKYSGTIEPKNC